MQLLSIFILGFFVFGGIATTANAQSLLGQKSCDDIQHPTSKAQDLRDGSLMMMIVAVLESQGKENLQPKFDLPQAQCLVDDFDSAVGPVQPIYSPWTTGMQTLHYQFRLGEGEGQRTFLVLYNGIASFMTGDKVFYVTETFQGETKFYAAYKSQPRYQELKKLILGILDGSQDSLIEVDWPEGSKELVINKYDSKWFK